MATRHHELPPLTIPGPFQTQQPIAFDNRQPLFSPALPTSLQQSFHSHFPPNNHALQTPMNQFFMPSTPGAPGRPLHFSHHKGNLSLAQFAAGGILAPNGGPMTGGPMSGMPQTPLGTQFPPQMMLGGGPGYGQHFVPRSRRTPSMSLGGPPKAVLGGPARKVSPMLAPVANATTLVTVTKGKKVNVNLPQETTLGEDGKPSSRPAWARVPRDTPFVLQEPIKPPDITTADVYPEDNWRLMVPNPLEVFLPGKSAWDTIKQKVIEEKLERLGVERGSGGIIPHIHAPHARAASISSPADPALLFFKLNKLQQSQTTSSSNSLSASPQPPHLIPDNLLAPRFQNRHGHSMSLAQPLSLPSSAIYNPAASFNPFGPNAVLGSDQIQGISPGPHSAPHDNIHAPQGRVPATISSLARSGSSPNPDGRPNFNLGFGLDIPEEEEPSQEDLVRGRASPGEGDHTEGDISFNQEENLEEIEDHDGLTPLAQSRSHSRHVSRLSAALSLRSVGGSRPDVVVDKEDIRSPVAHSDKGDEDAVGEWTGSEDARVGSETSEDESIGEWSNPSDEERARHQRLRRHMLRRAQVENELPRRLPNFPRPPDNTFTLSLPRDEDIVSNPSEEADMSMETNEFALDGGYYERPPSHSPRPLPPLPHSRVGSSQYSAAHSRAPSSGLVYPSASETRSVPASALVRRDSLNPFAKPFVFGARTSVSFARGAFDAGSAYEGTSPAEPINLQGHSRAPSLGRPLNAGAQEFTPGGFTFRPPPGVPQMSFPAPEIVRPLPVPPMSIGPSPARAQQGREKRQRRASGATSDGDREGEADTMSSFRFPAGSNSPPQPRRSMSTSPRMPRRQSSLNAAAPPFTFSGISSALPYVANEPAALPGSPVIDVGSVDGNLDAEDIEVENMPPSAIELPVPPTFKPKRAPVPLDFTHPVSSNTVPAGVFKALVNSGDERTRRTVRSRMSSRDIFDHVHRPSLDDLKVPPIARKGSRNRLAPEPSSGRTPQIVEDLFSNAGQHPSSLPASAHSSISSMALPEASSHLQRYEGRLEALLDEKLGLIREDLRQRPTAGESTTNATVEAMITEVVTLFRAQLQDSAARGLDESQMDARGELDFELIKDVVQQGHAENHALLQHELAQIIGRLESQNKPSSRDVMLAIEQLSHRTVLVVTNAMSQLTTHVEALESRPVPIFDHNGLLNELLEALTPALASIRPDPVDYEFLTGHLTQAVKPHISQLIDLASDKRETAGLIVDRLLPLLPNMRASTLDTDAIIAQLTAEVRSIIAPIDPFEIKEQVADLVVERLDSRLAVRDRAFNVETVTGKVLEGVGRILEPIQHVTDNLRHLVEGQNILSTQQGGISSSQKDVTSLLSNFPAQFAAVMELLHNVQDELRSKANDDIQNQSNKAILSIVSTVEELANGQKSLSGYQDQLLPLQHDALGRLKALPEALSAATSVLQATQVDLTSSLDASKRDLEDLRKSNTELQVQLAKARGAHGQVRVEKDALNDKVRLVEGDRDRLHSEVQELQVINTVKSTEAAALEKRNTELEEALAKALARLQASDVTAQSSQERIAELEKSNRELVSEKQIMKSKTEKLELQATFAARDQENSAQALITLQKQYDHLSSQQSHWDDLRHASEQIEMLTTLFNHADEEELKELRRVRDRCQVLESEHTALQKRFKDQESKVRNSEQALLTARQGLASAQQRSSEWERRAKEYEGKLEMVQTQLDQSEQIQTQLDADYSLAKLQLEEKDADERLAKDLENKLREQVSVLEGRVRNLHSEVERLKAVPKPSTYTPNRPPVNGTTTRYPSRPDSRTSTVNGESRYGTPSKQHRISSQASVRSSTPEPSVWDSIHAPKPGRYPKLGSPNARQLVTSSYHRAQAPSPTPSTISMAPTQGDDGWWS